ncbi:cobalamin biosynthesis protein P47K [Paenibacillus ihbetae]|uniref:Cobalamin biosynthesis protein P47K n=1 Tax=Paenibacillus ihbetae TaxID=1870820 RepID=A0A1B2E745_9BACL|nr:GTP-binding protein [Paenibacillus ihbetae]ANY75781.1 cobalamin biosynthesis protein P47K [Paenibacillus ihbetae]
MNKTPVIIISGFLGSGKTTLLLRLLAYAKAQRWSTAVIMNEMGEMDVDGAVISGDMPDVPVEKLLDGCICCTKRGELELAMDNQLKRSPDLILIETTGVANPQLILEDLAKPALAERISIARKVAVVDAGKMLEYNSFFASDRTLVRTLRGQIAFADTILLNKAGDCDAKMLRKVTAAVQNMNGTAKLRLTDYAHINEAEVFGAVPLPPRNQGGMASGSAAGTSFSLGHMETAEPGATAAQTNSHAASPALAEKTAGLAPDPSVAQDRLQERHAHHHDDGSSRSPLHTHRDPNEPTSYAGLDSLTLSLPDLFLPPGSFSAGMQELEAFFQGVTGLLRAKGYIRLDSGSVLVQWAGGKLEHKTSSLPLQRGYLTLIGSGLDKPRITEEWDRRMRSITR